MLNLGDLGVDLLQIGRLFTSLEGILTLPYNLMIVLILLLQIIINHWQENFKTMHFFLSRTSLMIQFFEKVFFFLPCDSIFFASEISQQCYNSIEKTIWL